MDQSLIDTIIDKRKQGLNIEVKGMIDDILKKYNVVPTPIITQHHILHQY